jgi:hypothetical protein
VTIAIKNPPAGGAGGSLECQLLAGVEVQEINKNRPEVQARNPIAVRETRLWMIREELYGDLDEIRIYAERSLRALEVENDLDLGRAFDQSVKHFRAVAANLKALVLVKTGTRL